MLWNHPASFLPENTILFVGNRGINISNSCCAPADHTKDAVKHPQMISTRRYHKVEIVRGSLLMSKERLYQFKSYICYDHKDVFVQWLSCEQFLVPA